jgi:hypothetical protein
VDKQTILRVLLILAALAAVVAVGWLIGHRLLHQHGTPTAPGPLPAHPSA